MVGMAFLATGVIVAMMVDYYVSSPASETAITRSRLWWEIVMNLQILSVALIWFCYTDRIGDAKGTKKRLHILMCCFAMLSVLMPSVLGAVSAANNWFEIRPGPNSFIGFFVFGVAFWCASIVAQFILLRLRVRYAGKSMRRRSIWFYSPAMVLTVFVAFDGPSGGHLWLVMTPILLYLQGAMPFFQKAFSAAIP